MDLYNFYHGFGNVVETLNKDRTKLTLKDYIIMCDPFFNLDFYDEKAILKQIGGGPDPAEEIEKIKELLERQTVAQEGHTDVAKTKETREKLEKEAETKAAIEAKEKELAAAEAAKQKAEDEKKKAKTKEEKAAAEKAAKDAEAEKARLEAESSVLASKSISDEEIAAASAELDKEVDELGPIKKMIKVATKVVVIFAMIVCLPLVPWILISFYSFKKLHGLYISYIQTY